MSSLVRCERPRTSITDIVNDVLGNSLFSWSGRDISSSEWPRIDITESKDSYQFQADLPGVDKKDVDISVKDGVLTINGEKKSVHSDNDSKGYQYYERSYGKFSRSFRLPRHVDTTDVHAELKNGVLALSIKKTEEAKPKQIEIKVE